ncbi:MAG: adenylate/guanylate cyclase domain-containing protein [Leptolyngbyaceae cyanobacterium SM1_1_3]|nr:adenylate/guanylate cyclase domain-containing protein [Leptolyngbyaceae cyanobacterium SM1_1_3]NJN01951.1 adenylate/guanylate cyclase domain-containing protein [Leptolyngbyaceae cyanobacterium RM1_1_2]NJO10592.1 adenylate/guanylate cyclase domain-containing protein [Leptolyngbyaceae cyanobacterium SL_1_1]
MSGILQSSLGLLKSRLSRRIVSSVFLSIVLIEGIIFVPSYFRRQQEKLKDLEQVSTEVLFTVKSNLMAGMASQKLLVSAQSRVKPDSVIMGAALYQTNGDLIDAFGETPELTAEALRTQVVWRRLQEQGDRYDVAWPAQNFQNQFVFVVRLDATGVKRSLRQYVLAISALVIIISIFVTLVTVIVLERILIVPILYLRDDLLIAGEAVSQEQPPDFYTSMTQRRDELGEVSQAFSAMFQRIRQEIQERKQAEAALRVEQEKSERLLLNILPAPIAEQLKQEPGVIASRFKEVTILFADIVDFTGLSRQVSAHRLVCLLNDIFSCFDSLTESHGLEKIKTIGDAYMVAGGLPYPQIDHAEAVMAMAIAMQQALKEFQRPDGETFHSRIGINTGPVVAGVIGIKKFSYDLWGDTVNVASRMESQGVRDRIQVSETTYQHLKHQYDFESRGPIQIKGRGNMKTYLY